MRVTQQPAFILHRREYGETSWLLEAFTRDYGRIALVAKGARRPTAHRRGWLNPWQPLLLGWAGKGELAALAAAESGGAALCPQGDGLYCGFYLNELLLRLLHRHDPHEALFAAYHRALQGLREGAEAAVLRIFEKHLLQEVGYGLVLDHEVADNRPLMPEVLYDYLPDRGPVRLASQAAPRGVAVHGATLTALHDEVLTDPRARREARALLRAALARHLGGRALNTHRLLGAVAAARAPNHSREKSVD